MTESTLPMTFTALNRGKFCTNLGAYTDGLGRDVTKHFPRVGDYHLIAKHVSVHLDEIDRTGHDRGKGKNKGNILL